MPASKFAEVHWPPVDRNNPGYEPGKIAEDKRDPARVSDSGNGAASSESPDNASEKSRSSWFGRRKTRENAQPAMKSKEGAVVTEAQTTVSNAAEIPLASPGRNGSDSSSEIGRSVPAPAGATRLTPVLLGDLTELESRCVDVAGRLSEVVQELLSGKVHCGSLASDLTALQADVQSLRNQTVDLAQSLDVPADSAPASTLGELRVILKAAAQAEDQRDFRLLHARAAEELEGVLALEYAGTGGANPLDECQVAGRHLLKEIAGAEWPNAHAESVRLAARRHAYSRLLDLVRQPEKLSDEDWQTAEETVTALFGKGLAVAAVRGRIQVKKGSNNAKEDAKTCPACGVPLEAGAKFCGDCGVKVE